MKFTQYRLLLTFIAVTLAITGCKKNEIISNPNQQTDKQAIEQFTRVPKSLNPVLQKIADKLKEKDAQNPFIARVSSKAGLPLWSKAQFKSKHTNNAAAREMQSGEQTVLIPLSVPNSTEVDGFIAAVIDANNDVKSVSEFDKFNYFLLGFDKPTTVIDAEDVAMQILVLQKEVFGGSKFKIIDNKLFNSQDGSAAARKNFEMALSETPQNSPTSSRVVVVKHNHCTGHDGTGPNGHEGGDCDECDWCGSFSYDIIFFDSPFDWGGGGGIGGGESGGGGWLPPPPVVLTTSNIWQNIGLTSYQQSFVNNSANLTILNKLATLMNNENFSEESKDATRAVIDAMQNNELNGPYTNQAFLNIMSNLSTTAVEGGAVAYWEYFNHIKSTSYGNSSFSDDELYWHITFDCSKTFNYFKNLWWNDLSYKPYYDNYVYTNNGYATGHHWWMNDAWLANFGGVDFGNWALDYLKANPTVKFSTFTNQFMEAPEGSDGDYDAVYWDNPATTFPAQNLPTMSSFSAAYPKHKDPQYITPLQMYTKVGGDVLSMYNSNPPKFQNTCALRISVALNGAGINIPAGTDRFKGADGKYYFLSAEALLKWMKKTFGTPTGNNHLTGSQGGTNGQNFPALLSGKNGIYIMIPNLPGGCPTAANPQGTGFCASGHADLLTGGVCDGGCYFNAKGGVDEIFIWELP